MCLNTFLTYVPRTSLERPIIWSPENPATGSRRRLVDVLRTFEYLFLLEKKMNRYVMQKLLLLKSILLLNHQFDSPVGPAH